MYTVDPGTGKLNLVEHIHTGGGHPRNFGISPDGRFLLVANRDGNSVVTFVRNDETGRLALSGHVLELSKPVCIRFMEQ
ncbi:6-phosphogluconolactonase [compost metagenome]